VLHRNKITKLLEPKEDRVLNDIVLIKCVIVISLQMKLPIVFLAVLGLVCGK